MTRRAIAGGVGVVALVAALLLLPPLPGITSAPPASSAGLGEVGALAGTPPTPVIVNLTVDGSAPIRLSSTFWGTTVSPRARLLPEEGELVNATPTQVIVWPGGDAGDAYDPMSNTIYNATGNSSPTMPNTSEADFVHWCRSIDCSAIVQVPAEIDNASIAAEVVNYTENVLGFHPAYWEIGNEPELWGHWDQPWIQWNETPLVRNITPTEYAWEVNNYSQAMRSIDPAIRVIGIAATGRSDGSNWNVTQWIDPTVTVDGANLSGVGVHVYPAGTVNHSAEGVAQFYGTISGTAGLPDQLSLIRGSVANTTHARCPACRPPAVFVTELGAALYHYQDSAFSVGFPGALDIAAQISQAIAYNATNVDLYGAVSGTSNSWFNLTGSQRTDYTVYSDLFSHLGPVAYPTQFQVPLKLHTPPSDNESLQYDLYAASTLDAADDARSDMMLVNLNLTTGVEFNPRFNGLAPYYASPTELWVWSGTSVPGPLGLPTAAPTTAAPIAVYYRDGLPTSWVLPPQTVAVVERYAAAAVPIQFTETGLPLNYTVGGNRTAPTRWFLNLSSATEVVNGTTSITEFRNPGTYDLSVTMLPLPFNRTVREPESRYEPFVASPIRVGSQPVNVTITFVQQYVLNVTNADPTEGAVTVFPGWTNASVPITLRATADPGDLFIHWFGDGPGHYNGTAPNITLTPTGRLRETAHFTPGYPVTFRESGLPAGTPWSLAIPIEGVDLHSSNATIVTLQRARTIYAFLVAAVPGYRTVPTNSSFDVPGAPLSVGIAFIRLTPPGPTFPVTFAEVGLPSGSAWSVTVRNATEYSTASTLLFNVGNGSFGYQASAIPGYRAHPPGDGFEVAGRPATVIVQFEQVLYQVAWEESGLGPNLSWSVRLNGVVDPARGAWTTAMLPNGTDRYMVPDSADYIPVPNAGTVVLNGSNVTIRIQFFEAKFLVTFSASGSVPTAAWRVRLSDLTVSATGPSVGFDEPNGTYTFDVTTPPGSFPMPSHGNVTVDATPREISIVLHPVGPGPIPPLWSLVRPALADVVFMVLAAWVTFALVRRMRRSP